MKRKGEKKKMIKKKGTKRERKKQESSWAPNLHFWLRHWQDSPGRDVCSRATLYDLVTTYLRLDRRVVQSDYRNVILRSRTFIGPTNRQTNRRRAWFWAPIVYFRKTRM